MPARRSITTLAPMLVALAACGDDIPSSMPSTDGASSGPGMVTEATTTPIPPADGGPTDVDSTAGEAGSSETGFPPPVPACGNGYVEAGEECDDANDVEDDACDSACRVPCGLEWSALVPGPTLDSQIEGLHVAAAADGGVAVAGFLREITTDRRGNQTAEDRTVLVLRWDPRGRLVWARELVSADGHADAAGIAIAADGDVLVATTVDAADGGRAIETSRLGADDGATLWSQTFEGDVPGGDDVATGLALGPDGDVVVAGHVRIADGDNDVWVRRMAGDDGTEVWTATHGGVPSGGFSTDTGGPVAVAPDGEVYVLARIYVDFETIEARLLRFSSDGMGVVWELPPDLPGTEQQWSVIDVAVADDGSILYAFDRSVGAELDLHVRKATAEGTVEWSLDREAFATEGSDWRVSGLAVAPGELVVAGTRANDFTIGQTTWTETWIARLDPDGTPRCQVVHQDMGRELLPPSVISQGVDAGPDAAGLVTGRRATEDETTLWLGRFRPQ